LLNGSPSAINPLHRRRWLQAMPTPHDRWTRHCIGCTATACVKEYSVPIELVAPEWARLVDLDQAVGWLASGFGADGSDSGVP
jgi:hypothetical protein